MKNFIVFIIIIAFTSTTFSQDFCEGSIIVNGDTINVGWRGKDKNYGNVPTNIIPLSTGWIPYAPFTDEFDTFDSSKWTKNNNTCHPMSTHAYFSNSSQNVYISNGRLILKARPLKVPFWCVHWDTAKNYNYSSGYIRSNNSIRYGYIEIKCKLPNNIALAPCFWLFGQTGLHYPPFTNYRYDEIDVFEFHSPNSGYDLSKTLMQNFYHNLHDPLNTRSALRQNIHFTNSFLNQDIIFAVEWLPEELHFYVNGHLTMSVKFADENSGYIHTESDFTCTNFLDAIGQKMQISLSVNSLISQHPDLSNGFEIDYIRSYKLVEGFNYEYWPSNFSMSDPNMFKVHKNIRLGGVGKTANIPSGENITIWATDGIILDKGFTVSGNTIFTARNIATTELFNY